MPKPHTTYTQPKPHTTYTHAVIKHNPTFKPWISVISIDDLQSKSPHDPSFQVLKYFEDFNAAKKFKKAWDTFDKETTYRLHIN